MGACVSKSSVPVHSTNDEEEKDHDLLPDVTDSDSDSCYQTINGPEDLASYRSFGSIGTVPVDSTFELDGLVSSRTNFFGYTKVRLLGQGSSSEVYEVEKDGFRFAAKFCYISPITVNFLNVTNHQPKQEAAILRNFNYPYIIKIYDIIDANDSVLMITELLLGGTILTIDDDEKKKVAFAQSLAAIEHSHDHQIAHRDIKPENILLDLDGNVRLCDFGISEYVPQSRKMTKHMMKGTPSYSAPEVFNDNAYDLYVADIWSLGATLYVLYFGELPFNGKNLFLMQKEIENSEPKYPEDADSDLVDLIKKMLKKNPIERISIRNIWAHPFLKGMRKRVDDIAAKMNVLPIKEIYTRKNSITFPANI